MGLGDTPITEFWCQGYTPFPPIMLLSRFVVLLSLTCSLTACSVSALGDIASMAGVGGPSGNGPEGPVSPPALTGSTSACHQGTWALVPESAWTADNLQRMGLGSDEYEYVGSEGDAWLTLQPDGTYQWSLNRFAVTLRSSAASPSSPTDVTVHLHGMLYGTAEPSGRTVLEMHHAAPGTPPLALTAYAQVTGGPAPLGRINLNAGRLLGANQWTADVSCSTSTLSLSSRDDETGALQNARYTRVR